MAYTSNIEAIELYNYIQNEVDLYRLQTTAYIKAEFDKDNGEYCNQYLEASVIYLVNIAARRYIREYCKGSNWREVFPFLIRRACAMHIANSFDIEIEAGNSWR